MATAWKTDCKVLQRVVHTAQCFTGAKLPAIKYLYYRRCQRKAQNIVKDSSHPSHRLFSLLPHDKRYQCIKSGTNRTLNSFYSQVIRLFNKTPKKLIKWLPGLPALTLFSHWLCTNTGLYPDTHTYLKPQHTHTFTLTTYAAAVYYLSCCLVTLPLPISTLNSYTNYSVPLHIDIGTGTSCI
jgi:hypothetical protein